MTTLTQEEFAKIKLGFRRRFILASYYWRCCKTGNEEDCRLVDDAVEWGIDSFSQRLLVCGIPWYLANTIGVLCYTSSNNYLSQEAINWLSNTLEPYIQNRELAKVDYDLWENLLLQEDLTYEDYTERNREREREREAIRSQ